MRQHHPSQHSPYFALIVIFFFLIQTSYAGILPFSSSSADTTQEEIDRWLASPVKNTNFDFHGELPNRQTLGSESKDRILILTPLKDAAAHLPHHFALLANLTYPHHLIDLGFIIGDTTDNTRIILNAELETISQSSKIAPFRSCSIIEKNLGDIRSQDVAARHGFQAQVKRRQKLAISRNALLEEALSDEHDWVYWRDVDVAESSASILEDLIAHGKDVVTPSKLRSRSQSC